MLDLNCTANKLNKLKKRTNNKKKKIFECLRKVLYGEAYIIKWVLED